MGKMEGVGVHMRGKAPEDAGVVADEDLLDGDGRHLTPPVRAGRCQCAQSERRRVRVQAMSRRRILPLTVAAALLLVVMILRRAAMRWWAA
jgi:hypothetical protein